VGHANAIITWTVVALGMIPIVGKTVFALGRFFRR
jgi:hypothetical protein